MKLQRTTIILIILALGLGAFVYFTEIQTKKARETVENQEQDPQKLIFNFAKNDLKTLIIETQGKTLKFEQTEAKTQPWKMIEPEKLTANEPTLSFLINLLIELKTNQAFVINKEQLKDYGLDQPMAKIFIELKNQQKHELILGKPNFDDTLIYAQVDPHQQTEDNLKIILVSKSFQYAVERDLNDWKQREQ
jgi:hypothetical protein